MTLLYKRGKKSPYVEVEGEGMAEEGWGGGPGKYITLYICKWFKNTLLLNAAARGSALHSRGTHDYCLCGGSG